jgi:hypothetical protein
MVAGVLAGRRDRAPHEPRAAGDQNLHVPQCSWRRMFTTDRRSGVSHPVSHWPRPVSGSPVG